MPRSTPEGAPAEVKSFILATDPAATLSETSHVDVSAAGEPGRHGETDRISGDRLDHGEGTVDAHGSGPADIAREAQERFDKLLDISVQLSQLENGEISAEVRAQTDRLTREFDVLVGQGANASPNQVLVSVLLYAESENVIEAAGAEASEADKKVLQAIRDRLDKAHIPFWTALASLGKIKEWSASLEISTNFFAVKGSGGISVTFGR